MRFMFKITLAILLVFVSFFAASAYTGNHIAQDLKFYRTSITNDFQALLVITPGSDFEEKLNSPESDWAFSSVEKLKIGEQAEVHVMFTNPELDGRGNADVSLDIEITRPDNTATEYKGQQGKSGKLSGATTDYYLADASIRLNTDPADPVGEWTIKVKIHDNNRRAFQLVSEKFILEK